MNLKLWEKYPLLNKKLNKTQEIMINQIKINHENFELGIQNLIKGNGKMLRAALLLLVSEMGPGNNIENNYENAAASIEIIHLASLIHDDVLDDSDLRRGKPTLNYNFGIHNSVYLGDYLFTQYFELLLQYAPNFQNLKYNIKVMEDLLKGELDQSFERFDLARTEAKYFDAIKGKTAELFKISMGEGAILSGFNNDDIKRFEQIGLNIGMAFQIRDDLRDFEPQIETNKPTLNDVQSGIYTLPIIAALKTDYAKELEKIIKSKNFNDNNLTKIMNILNESGSMKYSRVILDNYLDKAFSLLDEFPASKSRNELVTILKQLFNV